MTRPRSEWWDKASALAPGLPVGIAPTLKTVAALLAVAQHETSCGDAWPGEHNWGATTARSLHADEQAAIAAAGVHPSVGADHLDVERRGRAALAAAVDAGTIPDPGPGVALHCDSAPAKGPYFVFFAAFPDDAAGAKYFGGFFRTTAERLALVTGDVDQLAAAMYSAGYFTGFHQPKADYELVDGRWVLLQGSPTGAPLRTGAQLNVADYARALHAFFPGILAALQGWSPGADPPGVTEPAEPDLSTGAGLQQALNRLGAAPELAEDGVVGAKTRGALVAFQRAHGLPADGVLGMATLSALRAALAVA